MTLEKFKKGKLKNKAFGLVFLDYEICALKLDGQNVILEHELMKLGFGPSFDGEIDQAPEEIYKQVWNDLRFWETFRIRDLSF